MGFRPATNRAYQARLSIICLIGIEPIIHPEKEPLPANARLVILPVSFPTMTLARSPQSQAGLPSSFTAHLLRT